jgi:hypothetical protein
VCVGCIGDAQLRCESEHRVGKRAVVSGQRIWRRAHRGHVRRHRVGLRAVVNGRQVDRRYRGENEEMTGRRSAADAHVLRTLRILFQCRMTA